MCLVKDRGAFRFYQNITDADFLVEGIAHSLPCLRSCCLEVCRREVLRTEHRLGLERQVFAVYLLVFKGLDFSRRSVLRRQHVLVADHEVIRCVVMVEVLQSNERLQTFFVFPYLLHLLLVGGNRRLEPLVSRQTPWLVVDCDVVLQLLCLC